MKWITGTALLAVVTAGAWLACGISANEVVVPQVQALPATITDGKVIFQSICAACHGQKGEGNEPLRAPSIAGMPAWYVRAQLENFRTGRRGTDPHDAQGVLMTAMSKLVSAEQSESVAREVQALKPVHPARAEGDVALEEGKELFMTRCAECHRYNASGEMTFGCPPLLGLQGWYLEAQLEKFQSGHRGYDKNDANGTKMSLSSRFIESEQARHDVVAFILSLNTPADFGSTAEAQQ